MIYKKVLDYIKKNNLINDKEKIGVATSGGVDSMCLLKFFIDVKDELDIDICVLHLEHGIRGQDSIDDMKFVEGFCKDNSIEFISKNADVLYECENQKKSIETVARSIRYEFFEECCKQYGIDKVALAHHADDRAETFVFNMARGSGAKGLCSIEAFRKPYYIRPFLCLYKEDILGFSKQKDIPYRKDSTNMDLTYSRNRIRHSVMDELLKINPNVSYNINRTADILCDENLYLEKITNALFEKSVKIEDEQVVVDINEIKDTDVVIKRRLLRRAIGERFELIDIEFSHIEDIIKLCANSSGKKISISNNILCAISYNKLYIFKRKEKSHLKIFLNDYNCTFKFDRYNFTVSKPYQASFNQNEEYFDLNMDGHFVFRYREKDDYIYPLGMSGRKRLSDYLSDKKIPLHKRDDIVLLCKGNEVVWVVEHGINERFKVKNDTKCIYKIAFKRADI